MWSIESRVRSSGCGLVVCDKHASCFGSNHHGGAAFIDPSAVAEKVPSRTISLMEANGGWFGVYE